MPNNDPRRPRRLATAGRVTVIAGSGLALGLLTTQLAVGTETPQADGDGSAVPSASSTAEFPGQIGGERVDDPDDSRDDTADDDTPDDETADGSDTATDDEETPEADDERDAELPAPPATPTIPRASAPTPAAEPPAATSTAS